ncbi:hypothetical protein [Prevotella sp. tf2-5]|uniref:hypothetical protein n=1 Tax=Prevotella sp. tf2-5 TaxID=1761889 RepID=UPI0011608246|nr:hypothetical protein [Prevotella sp. tf2-5]
METIAAAWEKARTVEGFDADIFRKDACGAWIQKDMFLQYGSMYGWGVDLILPASLGGKVVPENIRALNCHNLKSKGSDYPSYKAVYTADGLKNKDTELFLTVNKIVRGKLKTLFENA